MNQQGADRLPHFKKTLVLNIIDFFQNEINSNQLSYESREMLHTMIQNMGVIFAIQPNDYVENYRIDLLDVICEAEQKIIEINKKQIAEHHNYLGNRAMRCNNFSEAIYQYTMAIQLDTRNAVYFCNRAEAYTYTLSLSIAYQDCEEAIKLNPQYARAYNRFGIVLMNLCKYSEACTAFQNALRWEENKYYAFNLFSARQKLAERIPPPPGFSQAFPMNFPTPLNPQGFRFAGPPAARLDRNVERGYVGIMNEDLDRCGPRLYIHNFNPNP